MVPVEPISLAIGAVSLASLFSLCVQCFELIQVGKNLAPDFELLIVKLSIEKRRLMIWGEALGVLRPDEKRDSLLDEPDTRQLVERILGNIQRLFTEAAALKADYGLDTVSSSAGQAVQGSVVCLEAFEISPIVKFQTQFSRARGKTGLKAKTCWAIRDSKKFITMVQHLKDLIDGLSDITTSSQTTIQRSQLIRQETDLIPDLQTLEVIESTCSDAEWRSEETNVRFFEQNLPRRRTSGSFSPASITSLVSWKRGRAEEQVQAFVLPCPNGPAVSTQTEIMLLCSTSTLVAYAPESRRSFTPVDAIPTITTANKNTSSRMVKAIRVPQDMGRPCLVIYCPPRRRYLHMALALLDKTSMFYNCYVQLRFDDRLLDEETGLKDLISRMKGYYADVEDALYRDDADLKRILEAVDMNWLEQRIESLTSTAPSNTTLDWGTIFRQTKDDTSCVGVIVMAGELASREMLNAAPVVPPETLRDGLVYRLKVLADTTIYSKYRWKAEHYCNVVKDKDWALEADAGTGNSTYMFPLSGSQYPFARKSTAANQRNSDGQWEIPIHLPSHKEISISTQAPYPTSHENVGASAQDQKNSDWRDPSSWK